MARPIKLNGREGSVVKAIGFGLGMSGKELLEAVQLPKDELCDILNTLLNAGYVETPSMMETTTMETMDEETFEVNASFASELKNAMKR